MLNIYACTLHNQLQTRELTEHLRYISQKIADVKFGEMKKHPFTKQ